MKKSQIIIVLIAIIAVIFLFSLPKFIVKDDRQPEAGKGQKAPNGAVKEEAHDSQIPEKDLKRLNELRKSFLSVSDKEKKVKFADSLAILFRNVNKFDSSAKYLGEIASLDPKKTNQIKAGDAYFDASTFALDQNKATVHGEKARAFYEKVLEEEPRNLEVKTKLAKTFVARGDENTMKGVQILREVIKEDPGNIDALFTLGTLSIQSNQFDKAVERFAVIVEKDPKNVEGHFWLAFSYMKLGEKKKARENFEKVKTLTTDPEVLAPTDSYLKELK